MTAVKPRPRDRVLDTAADLFYRDGVRGVGIDRIVAESGVSKMTLYRHFPTKDHLIVATLRERDAELRGLLEQLARRAGASPREQLLGLFRRLDDWFSLPGFRGCRFMNATIELAGASAEVEAVTRDHKEQIRAFLERLAREAGLARPAELSRELMILYEGAIVTAVMRVDPSLAKSVTKAARLLVDGHTRA